MKKKDKLARRRHAKAVQVRTTEKLKAWHHKHKDDVEYRMKRAEGSRRHLEQVYRDAELGRMARVVLSGVGELLARIADLKRLAERSSADETETTTKETSNERRR